MESKFKRFMKNPWTISIGSGLIVLVITIIIDAVSTKQIFSTIGAIFVAIWNGIVVFLNFDVKVWWILVALVFIFLVLYVIYKITDTKPFPKNHPMSYKQDNILGYKWKWLWIKDDTGCYNIDHLHPVCPNCDTPLRIKSDSYGIPRLKCLRCGQVINKELPDEKDVKMMIYDNIRRNYFKDSDL